MWRDLTPIVEAVQGMRRTNAVIYGLSGGLGLVAHLETDVVEEHRLVELGELNGGKLKPSSKVEQIEGVCPQGAQGKPTHLLGVEEVIRPIYFLAGAFHEPIGACARRQRCLKEDV